MYTIQPIIRKDVKMWRGYSILGTLFIIFAILLVLLMHQHKLNDGEKNESTLRLVGNGIHWLILKVSNGTQIAFGTRKHVGSMEEILRSRNDQSLNTTRDVGGPAYKGNKHL